MTFVKEFLEELDDSYEGVDFEQNIIIIIRHGKK